MELHNLQHYPFSYFDVIGARTSIRDKIEL